MHPRTAELADLLARERAALLAAVDAVPADRRDVAPEPGTWSVAEVLGHLQAVEGGSARLLARRLERAREAGLGPERDATSVLGRIPRALLLDGPAREAPEITRPTAGGGRIPGIHVGGTADAFGPRGRPRRLPESRTCPAAPRSR